MFKITNITTNESQVFHNKIEAAELIAELDVTENTVSTIALKLGQVLNNGGLLYEVLKVEEVTGVQSMAYHSEQGVDIQDKKVRKSRKGKKVEWYKDGELTDTVPSIKDSVAYMKEVYSLSYMPYTAVLRSIRKGDSWKGNSFKLVE